LRLLDFKGAPARFLLGESAAPLTVRANARNADDVG
jgi:hypothetical protein